MKEKNKKVNIKDILLENYEQKRTELLNQNYIENQVTFSIISLNVFGSILSILFMIVMLFTYVLIWGPETNLLSSNIILLMILVSIPIHELLHGLSLVFFSKIKWVNIYFGIMWKYLTPYCHCKVPLNKKDYILCCLTPCFILGLIPTIIGFVFNLLAVVIFGILNIACAVGDLAMFFKILKYDNVLFIDHPTQCGFSVFIRETNIEASIESA